MEDVSRRLKGQRLAPQTDIARTVQAVLEVLLQRIPRGEARRAVGALPGLAALVQSSQPAQPERFAFDELIARVVAASGATEDTAHRVVQAVFAELRRQLPRATVRGISSQLPADILDVWATPEHGSSSEEAAGREPAPRTELPDELRVSHPVFDCIEATAELPPNVPGAAAFVATLCLFMMRLPSGRAESLREALPAPLEDLLFRCTQQRTDEATVFDRAEFSDALAAELDVPTEDAARVAASVLRCVAQVVPEAQRTEVSRHLPQDLRALWQAHGPSEE